MFDWKWDFVWEIMPRLIEGAYILNWPQFS